MGTAEQGAVDQEDARFGTNGSKSINLDDATWYDHEASVGGGYRELYKLVHGEFPENGNGESCGRFNIVAEYDYRDRDGKLLFQVVRLSPKQFVQRRPDGNGGWIWKTAGVEKVLYRLPELIAAPLATVFVPEGEKDVEALRQRLLVATCNPGGAETKGASKWLPGMSDSLRGRDIVVLPDNDEAGEKHAANIVRSLEGKAKSVRVVRLPGLPDKGDVSDWLAAGGTAEELERLAKEVPPDADPRVDVPPPREDPLADIPTILCEAGKLHSLTNQAEAALIQAGAEVFQRADSLVRVGLVELPAADKRTTYAAGLYRIEGAALTEELAQVARWERFDMRLGKVVATDPPRKVVDVLAARKGRWRLRSVLGVITAPTLRPDGSILDAPGYDTVTRLYYAPDASLVMPPVKANPTEDDARTALAVFTDLFVEFPFVAKQDKAVGLSLPISAVVRGALGMVPVHAYTAPTPGSGKSYLADITSTIICGRWCPVIAPGSSQEELEKRLGAMVLAGHAIISLDNASGEIGGEALCQIAERPTVRIRILGKSEAPECEFRGVLIANGNNLVVSGDMVRRTLLGCLDSGLERPEERKFRGDPVRLILADRGKYISAAITIIRAYLEAGSPGKLSPLASYSEWSDLVRSALVWLGCADPVASMLKLRDADPVLTTLSVVLNTWAAAFGKGQASAQTAQQVAATFVNGFDPAGQEGEALTNLRAALAPVATGRGGVIDATKLGYWLRGSKLRPASGLKFDCIEMHRSVAGWFVT